MKKRNHMHNLFHLLHLSRKNLKIPKGSKCFLIIKSVVLVYANTIARFSAPLHLFQYVIQGKHLWLFPSQCRRRAANFLAWLPIPIWPQILGSQLVATYQLLPRRHGWQPLQVTFHLTLTTKSQQPTTIHSPSLELPYRNFRVAKGKCNAPKRSCNLLSS